MYGQLELRERKGREMGKEALGVESSRVRYNYSGQCDE